MKLRTLLIAALAVLVAAGAGVTLGWYFGVPAAIFGEDRELQQAVDLMKGYLAQWGLPVPTQREEIIRSFFHYYSRDAWPVDGEQVRTHPDLRFLETLPDRFPAVPRNWLGNFRTKPLRDYIRQQCIVLVERSNTWRASVEKTQQTAGDQVNLDKSLMDLVEHCVRGIQFRPWWQQVGARELRILDVRTRPLTSPQRLLFYRMFCMFPQPDRWQSDAAKAILKELRAYKWQTLTEEDCQFRPYLVFAWYFRFLSQEHFEDAQLKVDSYAAYFVQRLPKKPFSMDGVFSDDQELIQRLNRLREHINPKTYTPAQTLATALDQLRRELDFDGWLQKVRPLLVTTQEDKTPRILQEFVQRFQAIPSK
ncbi:MAG: hypothetical protein NZM42_12260 [Gemmatales bacterium]|nr:hypothetical protein [Gemmatales bacterium]